MSLSHIGSRKVLNCLPVRLVGATWSVLKVHAMHAAFTSTIFHKRTSGGECFVIMVPSNQQELSDDGYFWQDVEQVRRSIVGTAGGAMVLAIVESHCIL